MHHARSGQPGAQRGIAAVLLLLAWLACAASALTEPVNRDEHMYLGAASLVGDQRIYSDFAFLQTPYSAWTYHLAGAVAPGNWVLLTARLVKVAVSGGIVLLLFALCRRFGARPFLAAGLVLLLFQNELVRQMAGLARNYDFAQLAVLGALVLLPPADSCTRARIRLFAAGALATAAIGFKLTYAPLALLALVWPIARGERRRGSDIAALGLGAVAGLVPLFVAAGGVDPVVLRFNLLDYHFLNAEFHVQEGYEPHADLLDRAARGLGIVLAPSHRPLVGMALAALLLGLAPWPSTPSRRPGRETLFGAAFLLAAIAMGVLPRPLQTYYFAPVFYGLVLLVAALAGRMTTTWARSLTLLCAVLLSVDAVVQAPQALDTVRTALDPDRWTGVRVHRDGRALARAAATEGPVATTHPIHALEGGLEIYPELGAGEFAWRSGSLLEPQERRRFRVVAAGDLDALLDRRPPSLVLVETTAPWDEPLRRWALSAGWTAGTAPGPELAYWTP